jgi:nicotinamide mononucleotide (NMN) deamidase PncC
MTSLRDQWVEDIHASGYQACIIVAGGGVGAVHALLSRPGASRFVFDVRIPYGQKAMDDLLGDVPLSYCSEATAKKMAQTAFNHASRFTTQALGIACTAALQTNRERGDDDRACLCICSADRTVWQTVELSGGSREEQDALVSKELLSYIARFVAE